MYRLVRVAFLACICLLLSSKLSLPVPENSIAAAVSENKISEATKGTVNSTELEIAISESRWNNLMGEQIKGPANDSIILQVLTHDWAPIVEEEKSNPAFTRAMPKPYSLYWGNLHKISSKMSLLQRAKAVNGFVNVQMRSVSEGGNVPYNPKWRSPRDFMKAKWGDCKDYAVMKYFAMRDMGFDGKDLRVVILKMSNSEVYHATLAAYINNEIYILDNNFRPADLVLPHTKFTGDWLPLYAFNENSAWCYNRLTREGGEFKVVR